MITIALIIIATLMLIGIFHRPLSQVLENAFRVIYGIAEDVQTGLHSAASTLRNWWKRNFTEVFTVRTFIGGIILSGFVVAFILADYTLLVMAIASLFPLEAGKTQILGLTLLPPDQMAMAIIAGQLLFGFLIFELLSITHFMPWGQQLTKRARIILAVFPALLLIGLSSITSSMAAWRTNKMQQIALAESTTMSMGTISVSSDTSLFEANTTSQTAFPTKNSTSVKPSFLDRLPTPASAALGFLVPMATAVAGIGIYWLLLGFVGILAAVLGLLPMLLMDWMAGAATRLVNGLYWVVAFLLRLLAMPARLFTRHWSLQQEIDEDGILPLETTGLSRATTSLEKDGTSGDDSTSPSEFPKADDATAGSPSSVASSDGAAQDIEEMAAHTQDLEEELEEFRAQDRRRAHAATIDPLGIGTHDFNKSDKIEEE